MTRSYKGKEIAPVNLGFIKIDRATYEVLKFIKEKLKITSNAEIIRRMTYVFGAFLLITEKLQVSPEEFVIEDLERKIRMSERILEGLKEAIKEKR